MFPYHQVQAESREEKDAGCCGRHTGNHLHPNLSLDQDMEWGVSAFDALL